MRRACVVIVVAAFATGLGVPVASGQGGVTDCGDVDKGVGIKNVTARGVTCKQARRIARTHPRDATPEGFRCKDRTIARYTYDIRCTRGSRVVRWQYNSE